MDKNKEWAVKNKLIGIFNIVIDDNGDITEIDGGKIGEAITLVIPEGVIISPGTMFKLKGHVKIIWGRNTLTKDILKGMFKDNVFLESIIMKSGDSIKSKNYVWLKSMFEGCQHLVSVDMSGISIECTYCDMDSLFEWCERLQNVELFKVNSNGCSISKMFKGCSSIKSVDLSCASLGKIEYIDNVFNGCSAICDISINCLDVSECISFTSCFSGCVNLERIDISSWITTKAYDMEGMFKGCKKLEYVYAGNIDTRKVSDASAMFKGCSSLKYIDIPFQFFRISDMSYMFSGCSRILYADTSRWNIGINTSEKVLMLDMFESCHRLKYLDANIPCKYNARVTLLISGCYDIEYVGIKCNECDCSFLTGFVNDVKKLKYINLYDTDVEGNTIGNIRSRINVYSKHALTDMANMSRYTIRLVEKDTMDKVKGQYINKYAKEYSHDAKWNGIVFYQD